MLSCVFPKQSLTVPLTCPVVVGMLVAHVDSSTAQVVPSRSKRSIGHGWLVGLVILYLLKLPTCDQTDLSQAQT